jgi:hypothetical protein
MAFDRRRAGLAAAAALAALPAMGGAPAVAQARTPPPSAADETWARPFIDRNGGYDKDFTRKGMVAQIRIDHPR